MKTIVRNIKIEGFGNHIERCTYNNIIDATLFSSVAQQ